MESALFHGLDRRSDAEIEAGNVREFVADGTPYLPVPGLQELLGVRIGRTVIPLEMVQQFPVSVVEGVPPVSMPLPMVALELAADGTPVLLRSKQSNDGIWQAGQRVYVRGNWEEEPDAELPILVPRKAAKRDDAD